MISWWLRWPPSLDNGQGMLPPPGPGPGSRIHFIIRGKTRRPHTPQPQPGHTCPALLNKFLSLCLDKFYWEPSENYHEQGHWDQLAGQMQTKLESGNVEEFSLRIRIRINNWLSGCCCKSNPCDNWDVKGRSWSRSTPGVGLSFSEQSSLIWNVIHLSESVRADSTGQPTQLKPI